MARLEHHPSLSHPRIATRSNNAACVCVTSLGRLTRATERPIFGREARNNEEKIWSPREGTAGSLSYKKSFLVRYDFLRSIPLTRVMFRITRRRCPPTAILMRKRNLFDVFNRIVLVVVWESTLTSRPSRILPLSSIFLSPKSLSDQTKASRRSKRHRVFVSSFFFFSFHFLHVHVRTSMARTTRITNRARRTSPFAVLFREKKGKAQLCARVCVVMRVVSLYACEWDRGERKRDVASGQNTSVSRSTI